MVFLDESGFCLVPTVKKTWALRGQTPILKVAGSWTKISAISAISVSSGGRRIELYARFHPLRNIKTPEVLQFLRHLAQHLRRGFVLVWDRGASHKSGAVRVFLKKHGKIHMYFFPGYAPELNPDEFVWNRFKHDVANGVPKDTDELGNHLKSSARKLGRSRKLPWSCIRASELPWKW